MTGASRRCTIQPEIQSFRHQQLCQMQQTTHTHRSTPNAYLNVFLSYGRPLVHVLAHRRRRTDGVDKRNIAHGVGDVGGRLVTIHHGELLLRARLDLLHEMRRRRGARDLPALLRRVREGALLSRDDVTRRRDDGARARWRGAAHEHALVLRAGPAYGLQHGPRTSPSLPHLLCW